MKRLSNGRSSNKTRPARVSEHSYEPEDEEITTRKLKLASLYEKDDDEAATEDEEEAGYSLRHKHRKIWRISSIKNGVNTQHQQQQQKFVCSKCGKGFQSLKAKCGHMASHSEKEKAPISNLVAKQKLAMDDSRSDTESGAQRQTRRSKKIKDRKHNSVSVAGSKAKVAVYKNCSSEDSGVEQEQEEVAISLMMLSRDSANWGGLNSVDSSDNNSVILEARSCSTKVAAHKNGLSSGHRVDETLKKLASKEVTALGDSVTGFVRSDAKNVDNVEKVSNFSKNEAHLSLRKLERVMDAGSIRDSEGYNQTFRPYMDWHLKKSVTNEPYIAGYNLENQHSNSEMYQRFEHKAGIHSQSHQHFNTSAENHKTFTAVSPYESSENRFETNASLNLHKGKGLIEHNVGDKWKEGKHECLVSSKFFRSGQARRGHMRIHSSDGYDEIKSDEVDANFKQSGTQMHNLFDLNLPAPTEDDEASESMASYH